MTLAKWSFVKCGDWFKGISHLSYAIVCFHPSVSSNNEKNCCALSEDKIAVCEKTAGLGSGDFSDFNSACWKVLVPILVLDMLNENRFLDTFRGHSKWTIQSKLIFSKVGLNPALSLFDRNALRSGYILIKYNLWALLFKRHTRRLDFVIFPAR